ncbi:MAG: 4-diphosphocytidyl-2C-methyl-D-erythritol synthase [Acidobacteriaceae bacterium]|nr:4-diphosphocytidyl-2C-methyl-D-erythritol synthase [Acidobacteriaceae bacterium]
MIAAIILAAGASRRLGEPKQLVCLGSENLLERAVRVAQEAKLAPVIVVLGHEYPLVLGNSSLGDAVTVINDEWQEGMASSIRRGIKTCLLLARQAEGAVIMACDQPAVTAEHLRKILLPQEITASEYAGRKGVPAYFPAKQFATLLELQGDAGARDLVRDALAIHLLHGELDVDTVKELEHAKTLFR